MGKKLRSRKEGRSTEGAHLGRNPHRAHTFGYEDCLFTFSSMKLPTDFLETQKQLTRYLSTQTHDMAAMDSIVYRTMTDPNLSDRTQPEEPAAGTDGEVTKTKELKYQIELELWASEKEVFLKKKVP